MNPKYRLAYFVLGIITGIAFLTSGSISPIEEPITFFGAFFVIMTVGHLIDWGLQKLARLPNNPSSDSGKQTNPYSSYPQDQ